MNRPMSILIAVAAAFAVPAATAARAIEPPSWNSGYDRWWPGGFGYAPQTVHAPGYPCSATAYGPTYKSSRHHWHQLDGAGVSCGGGVGIKTLTLSVQVLGPAGHRWFTLPTATVTVGPTSANPVRLIRTRPALLGHEYRTVVAARLVVPNGHAGCSFTNSCDQSLTITAVSRGLAP